MPTTGPDEFAPRGRTTDLRALSRTGRRIFGRYRRVVAALLAAVAALTAIHTVAPGSEPGRPVVVAAADLTGGTALSGRDLRVVHMPGRLVPSRAAATPSDVIGRVLAGPMRAGEVMTDVRFVGRSLVAGYPPGTVAAAVRLGEPGVVDLLAVGDRVVVFAVRSDDSAAEPVVADAPIVALPRSSGGSGGTFGGGNDDAKGLVVLAVTRSEAALLAEASATAPLSVALLP